MCRVCVPCVCAVCVCGGGGGRPSRAHMAWPSRPPSLTSGLRHDPILPLGLTYNFMLPEEALSWLMHGLPPSSHPSIPYLHYQLPFVSPLVSPTGTDGTGQSILLQLPQLEQAGWDVWTLYIPVEVRHTCPSLQFPTQQCLSLQSVDVVAHPPVMVHPLNTILKCVGIVHLPSPYPVQEQSGWSELTARTGDLLRQLDVKWREQQLQQHQGLGGPPGDNGSSGNGTPPSAASAAEVARRPTGVATVVGESFGGCLALRVALWEPSLVQRLVLINPATCFNRFEGPLGTVGRGRCPPWCTARGEATMVIASRRPDGCEGES